MRIVLDKLKKRNGPHFTLGPLDTTLGTGVTGLIGANGAGKSTLFRMLAGIDRQTSGQIVFKGRGEGPIIGYLPQDLDLPPFATCSEFLTYVAWVQGVDSKQRQHAVDKALKLTGLSDRARSPIRTLSGGMKRRLGIAHAVIHEPEVMLLDEPTAGLDPRQRLMLRRSVEKIAEGRVVLLATHLVEDVKALADRAVVLRDGSVQFDGTVAELESLAPDDAPGNTDLERSIAALMGVEE
jgi:ABC-2 type transport system ATP-binding protein